MHVTNHILVTPDKVCQGAVCRFAIALCLGQW